MASLAAAGKRVASMTRSWCILWSSVAWKIDAPFSKTPGDGNDHNFFRDLPAGLGQAPSRGIPRGAEADSVP